MATKVDLIDAHCEGEIGRVIIGGDFELPGGDIAAKIRALNAGKTPLHRLVMREPRGMAASHAVLLSEPTCDEADAGLIILACDKAHAMSGSNVICATKVLLETGRVAMVEPETTVTFETALGLVRARANCRNGHCLGVSLDMPPAHAEELDVRVSLPDGREIIHDVAWGGTSCALVDVAQTGLKILPDQASDLARAGVDILAAIRGQRAEEKPGSPEVAYVMFRDALLDGTTRTCSVILPGRVDRSPCGTGSTAHLATQVARGLARPGDDITTCSIINGRFKARVLAADEAGQHVQVRITGRAWIHARTTLMLDPSDPFPLGFLLSDTWGAAVADMA